MAENINNTSLNDENSVSSFDYKAFLLMMLLRWPIILGCVLVALIGSFFYIKTLTPQYTVSSTILIKDESKSKSGKSGIDLQELGLITSSAQNFDNELGILQTHTLVKKVVCNLNLYIHYSSPGTFRSEELYKDNAVNVWVTPEDAEKIKHADVRMKLTDKKVLDVEIKTKEKTFSNHFDRLPAVLPTEIGVFSFSLPDTTVIAKKNVAEDEEDKKDGNAPIVVEASINAPSIATKSYLTRLTVAATSKTTTIANLTLTDSHIERAKDFLTSLVNLYNQEANNDKNEVASKTAEFINERITIINEELGSAENRLAAFKQGAGLVDITNDAALAVQERSTAEKAYADNETQIRLLQFIKEYINNDKNRYDVIPGNIGLAKSSELSAIINTYNEMLIERKRLQRTTSDTNPALINLDEGIAQMRQNVELSIRTAEEGLLITRRELQHQANKYSGKVSSAPIQEKEFLSMSRQQEIKANLYLMLLQKREENNITLASTANNARVIDDPMFDKQVSPKGAMIYLIAFILGLGIPAGIIYLLSLAHYKIETRGDVEKLTNLPVIGDIPMTEEVTSSPIVVHENKNGMMEEVYRSIRTNVQYMLNTNQKVILFTSTTSGEGKSFTSGNLACSFAFMGKRTVIVGLDIRKPGLNKVFRLSHKERGITQFLVDPENVDLMSLCQQSEVSPNLFILPGGTIPPNPTELIARPALDKAIEILKKNFDYVILDTAPIGMVTDTQLIARCADMSVYICRSNVTAKSDFQLINELSREQKLPNPCVILNCIDMSKRTAGSYYGYGKYGRYGRYGYGKKYGYGYGYGYGHTNEESKKK